MPQSVGRGFLAAISLVAGLGLAACGPSPTGGALAPAPSGVTGTVVSVDDTGLPDFPSGGGWLAAVPADRVEDLLALAGKGYPEDQLPYAGFPFAPRAVTRLGGVTAEVDADGRFSLPVSGEQIVCRLVEGTSGPVAVGCDHAVLPARGTLSATKGEGGFHVSAE